MPVIGFLHSVSHQRPLCNRVPQWFEGTGFVEGQSVAIEYRWAEGRNEQPPTSGPHDKPHRALLRRRGEVRPFFHLHSGDELVATVLGVED
jgi:hypothetical protein